MNPAAETSPEAFDDAMVEALASQSREAFENYSKTLSKIERSLIGTFSGVPEKLSTWMFYRVGLKSSSVAQAMAHVLREQGWKDAPKCVRFRGTEMYDGADGALILMAVQDVYRRQKDIERRVLEKNSPRSKGVEFDGLENALAGTAGVEITEFDVSVGESTAADAMSRVQDARARRLNKRG